MLKEILKSFKFLIFLLIICLLINVYKCEKLNDLAKGNPAVINSIREKLKKPVGRYCLMGAGLSC